MAKTKISEYDAISANNTDVDSINIAEGCAPSGINNAIREVMAHLKDFQTGASGDSLTVGGNLSVTGTVTIPDNAISGDKVEGGTINAITINTLTAGQANFGDNAKAIFGDGSDLQIYHDGTASYIAETGTGPLNIQMESTSTAIGSGSALINFLAKTGASLHTAANLSIHQPGTTEGIGDFRFSVGDGAGVLTETLRVNSTGIDVTGTVVSDGLTVDGNIVQSGGSEIQNGGTLRLSADYDASGAGNMELKTQAILRQNIHNNGDISFYEDTGTTAKFFWDASAESLGIGTSSISAVGTRTTLHVAGASGSAIRLSDDTANAFLDYTDASGMRISVNANEPLTIRTNSQDRLIIDSEGNLGLGVTPSASWWASMKSIGVGRLGNGIFGSTGDDEVNIGANVINTGSGTYIYGATDTASLYRQVAAQHVWYYAGSGTAGTALTPTEAMRINASGNVGIGTSSPSSELHIVDSAANATLILQSSNTGTANVFFGDSVTTGVGRVSYDHSTDSLALYTGSVERLRITSAGNVGIGTSSPSRKLHVYDTGSIPVRFETNTSDTKIEILTTSGTQFIQGSANNLLFGTNNTERVRIDSSGNLLVGRNTETDGSTGFTASNAGWIRAVQTSTKSVFTMLNSTGTIIEFRYNTGTPTAVGSISTNGSSTAYNTSSDYRLKNNIAPMTGALAKVQALKPVTYKWNADGSDGEGFIAHELAEVVPQCVTGEKDAVDADGKPVYQGIDTSFLVATLTAAIQEQQAIIESLKARLDAANL